MNTTISKSQIRAAFRALSIGAPADIVSVGINEHALTVHYQAYDDATGKPLVDPETGKVGVYTEVIQVEEEDLKPAEPGGTGLSVATVTLALENGARYEFRLDTDTEYLANVQNVAVTSGDENSDPADVKWESTGVTYVDLHIFGGGIASQLAIPEKPEQ